MLKNTLTKRSITILREIVAQNSHFNFTEIDLSSDSVIKSIRKHGIAISVDVVVDHLKAFQRIERITSGFPVEVTWSILENGLSSAIEIAGMNRKAFIGKISNDGKVSVEIAGDIHRRARNRRSELLPHYMNILQNNEPHISQAAI